MPRKPKPLRDMRPRVSSFPEKPDDKGRIFSEPAATDLDALARRHGFPPDFDLAERLDLSWFWWRNEIQSGSAPTATERRSFLLELAQRADLFREAVHKLGIPDRGLIFDCMLQPVDLAALERESRSLAAAAKVAARHVSSSKRGAKGNPDTINLLCKLVRIYREAFGPDAPRISRFGTQYGGKLFDFAEDVCRLFGVRDGGNNSLGKMLQKALNAVDARDAKSAMP